MAELTGEDVATFTNDRLADTEEVQRLLAAALTVARREVGWHVSPVRQDTLTVDGMGGRKLYLPTGKVVELRAVANDGATVDLSKVAVSADVAGLVVLKSGRWTCEFSGITVELEHGYTEDEAADWRQAILTMVDQMSLVPITESGRSGSELVRKRVDDVEYQWAERLAEQALWSVSSILDGYRLPQVLFA